MKFDKMILGQNTEFTTDSEVTQCNNNVLVVAGSGSGKTMSILEPRLLEAHNASGIISLSKNRLVFKYRELLKKRGYDVKHIDFACFENSTDFYDPMTFVHNHNDVAYLAEALVKLDPGKNSYNTADPYWDEISISLLSAEIGYVLETYQRPTFEKVLELHSLLRIEGNADRIITTVDKLFDRLAAKDPQSQAVQCWRSFRDLPMRTANCAYSSLNVMLDKIFNPDIRKVMSVKRSVNPRDLADRRTMLFVTTSPVSKSLHGLANLFLAQTIKELFEYAESRPDGKLPIPVELLCDDFACGVRIHGFEEYISIFREKGISCTLLLQSESQLAHMYGDRGATTIINNCDTYVFAGSNDLQTARSISVRANLPLEDVLYMPIGTELIFRRGSKPIKTQRYAITKDPRYQEVTKAYDEQVARQMAARETGDRLSNQASSARGESSGMKAAS